MSVSAFISRDDGYTRKAFIAEVFNLYPSINIAFRPSTLNQRSSLVFHWEKERSPEAKNRLIAKYMATKIVEWDLVDETGLVAKITAENILQIAPDLFVRVRNIVAFMQDGGDRQEGDDAIETESTEDFLKNLQKN